MKIYTSYFGNIRKLPEDFVRISIARYQPKWFNSSSSMLRYRELFPTKDLLESWKREEINEKEYREIYYRDVLSKTTPQEIYSVLERTFGGRDIVFLCYEKGFCHRHLVAEWMNSAGYEVTEYEG